MLHKNLLFKFQFKKKMMCLSVLFMWISICNLNPLRFLHSKLIRTKLHDLNNPLKKY